jgi:transcriptional regulator with XRE-family HTH domain
VESEEAHRRLGLDTFLFDRSEVGKILKTARGLLNLTLKEVEACAGIAASHIWSIERGAKEVALERVLKLAIFYGFPPGLVIEAGIRVNSEPIRKAAAEWISTQTGDLHDEATREMYAELVAGFAVILAYLLRSTRPGFLIETFAFPTFEMKNRFRRLAGNMEYGMPPTQRTQILIRLPLDPVPPLVAHRLLDPQDAEKFCALARAGTLPFSLPWNPVPRYCLPSLTEAIHIEPMSVEEFAYIQSLTDRTNEKMMKAGVVNRPKSSQAPELDKNNLTTNAESATSLPMQSTAPKSWKDLRAGLQALTAERGAKAQLAADLKVSRQVVTSWLKKKKANEPSADFTLRLLAWVAARKAKQ